VLAEWVEDGEAVIIRGAQYTAFSNAKDMIERYRSALPPEPPAATGGIPGFTPLPSNPQWGLPSQPTAPSASWDAPIQPSAPDPQWGLTGDTPGPPLSGSSAGAAPLGSGTGPTAPSGMPGSEVMRDLMSQYPERVQQFAREHPEAVQEFLSNPQQFMREHPEVVREFLMAQRAQRMGAAGGGPGSGTGPGMGLGMGTGPAATTVRPRRRGRGCFTGCLVVVLIVVVLGIANSSRVVAYVKSFLTPTPTSSGLIRFGAANVVWSQTHTPDSTQPAGSASPAPFSGSGQYTATTLVDGHVVGYTLHFASGGVTQSTALTAAKSELPGDATRVYNLSNGQCEIYQYRSTTLANALGDTSSSDSNGRVDITLSSAAGGTGFDQQHIVMAVLALGKAGDQTTGHC